MAPRRHYTSSYPTTRNVHNSDDKYGSTGTNDLQGGMSASTIEHENEQNVGFLGAQVNELRSISLMIGDEVVYQRKMLAEMEQDFDNSDNILSNTMKRLKVMASKQSGLWVWLLLLMWILACMYIYFFRY